MTENNETINRERALELVIEAAEREYQAMYDHGMDVSELDNALDVVTEEYQ